MKIKNINLSTVKDTGVSIKFAKDIRLKAKNIQPEVEEILKNINKIPSEILRANWMPKVKKPESITSKV